MKKSAGVFNLQAALDSSKFSARAFLSVIMPQQQFLCLFRYVHNVPLMTRVDILQTMDHIKAKWS